MSVVERIFNHSESRPDCIAVYENDRTISYENLASDIKKTAAKLVSLGVTSEDAVLVRSNNSYSFILLYFSIHYVGAKFVNVAPDSDVSYVSFIEDKVNPKLFIEKSQDFIRNIDSYTFDNIFPPQARGIADIMFTSGTTGEPKGVLLSHKSLVLATEHIISHVKNTNEDVELLLMPLSHSFAMARMRTSLFAGGAIVVGCSFKQLKSVFKAIEFYKVTGLGLVPSAWSYITLMTKDLIRKYSEQLNFIEFGSAHFPFEDKKQVAEWFPNTNVVMHYGLTEVSRATFIDFHNDDINAVGHRYRGADFKIIDNKGAEVIAGEEGEIVFNAPWMLDGYFENSQLTSDCFVEGYFKTGDLGRVVGDYLFLTGRLKEIINVGGKKVSPDQVEKVLSEALGVQECACAALSDANMGEVVQAYIVVKSGWDCENVISNIKETINGQLPMHMRPKKYSIVSALPKPVSGKGQRYKLSSE
ncbi:AMP-binding protein [Vibrio cholerae]|uniref:AMP-binding protein n=1 Tax=Vibrio cholerae TaxID=666 RepID=UPI000E6A45F4|nr:AMP-binding protein [Vibrio cholerae]